MRAKMETIVIPSPTAFLSSPVLKPAPEPPPPPKQRKPAPFSKTAAPPKKPNGIVKPKQSKSRNGCITCKAKRLKCDETKPTCQQCHKRSVTCGKYKKDFKWRPFEETTFVNKSVPAKPSTTTAKRRNSVPASKSQDVAPSPSDASSSSTPADTEDVQMQDSFFHAAVPTPPPPTFTPPAFQDMGFDHGVFDMGTPTYMRELPRPRFEPDTVTRSLSSLFEDTTPASRDTGTARPSFSGQSPRLIDLLLPGSELNARPGSVSLPPMMESAMDVSLVMDHGYLPPLETASQENIEDDIDIEEIIRSPPPPSQPQTQDTELWMSLPISRSNTTSPTTIHTQLDTSLYTKMYPQPLHKAGSTEMLMLRFDKQTCGILSIKDGPTENPWRTLIWPLAQSAPVLYHAIASMTAFHSSKTNPSLRNSGVAHMQKTGWALQEGFKKNILPTDVALATTLVLAFCESWDQHIATGIWHLKAARILIKQALDNHRVKALEGEGLARMRFLCNTWMYMDVIARLTSVDDDAAAVDWAPLLAPLNTPPSPNTLAEIDPLMGCATELFPILGKVANLCRRVRKSTSNSIAIISQAIELKEHIVQWCPPALTSLERPEDPTSEIQHALQTAEAYRYATLLYLHQAVPEIPSWSSAQLAKKVLVYLATVPLSSRLVIVQIFPLLAAGAEAMGEEDREWVRERWGAMGARMLIGNIDKCWEVTREVWRRRDAAEELKMQREIEKGKRAGGRYREGFGEKRKFEEELALVDAADDFSFEEMLNANPDTDLIGKRQRMGSGTFSPSNIGMGMERKRVHEPVEEEMDSELTVRGPLHWVGVMQDWNWEILLG